ATLCALNMLAQLKACIGDLDNVVRVVKLTGFVNADGTFEQHPQVINGASSLMLGLFGDAGQHSRAAVGCSSLPGGVICEVEGVFEVM
ncbi:MAG: RidA family protein, partial [Pseudomonadota bacterium]